MKKAASAFTAALVIGIVLVILIAYTAIGQDGETMTLAEVVELTAETLMELQKTVERIADTAADKTEVHALETRGCRAGDSDAPADRDSRCPGRQRRRRPSPELSRDCRRPWPRCNLLDC